MPAKAAQQTRRIRTIFGNLQPFPDSERAIWLVWRTVDSRQSFPTAQLGDGSIRWSGSGCSARAPTKLGGLVDVDSLSQGIDQVVHAIIQSPIDDQLRVRDGQVLVPRLERYEAHLRSAPLMETRAVLITADWVRWV